MNTLIYPDASPAGFPKFNSSLHGAFVVQIRREEKAETEAGSQTPAGHPPKFRHLVRREFVKPVSRAGAGNVPPAGHRPFAHRG
jgi:hypothetical protein